MDYTAPDKIVGSNWTATEHNQLKQAVNSKLDANAVVQDLTSPSNTQVLSTSALNTIINTFGGARNRGNLTGAENIDGEPYKTPGIWIGVNPFQNPAHASFPTDKPGVLRVNANAEYITQEYITLDGIELYIRRYHESSWSAAWTQFVTKEWVIDNYGNPANFLPDGTPTVESPDVDNIVVTPLNCIDTAGKIAITNTSLAASTIGMIVTISPQYPRNIHGVSIIPGDPDSGAFSVFGTSESGQMYIQIDHDIPVSGSSSFYYTIK